MVPGLCGGPDVPHVAPECKTDLAEGNDVGVSKAPPVSMNKFLNDLNNSAQNSKLNGSHTSVKLIFKISPVAGLEVCWETTLMDKCLYMELAPGILPEGSKESLVTLLEYAEDKLKCKKVVICFDKGSSDRVSLLRVFNFFGFQMLPPHHELVTKPFSHLIFMAYTIESDSDESDDETDDDDVDTPRKRERTSSGESTDSVIY